MKKAWISILVVVLLALTASVFASEFMYVGSKNSDIYHVPSCPGAERIKDQNKVYFKSLDEVIADGRRPCSICIVGAKQPVPIAVDEITVTVDGVPVVMADIKPFIENGRTYVPVRAVLEAYGVESINWEAPNVIVITEGTTLKIPVGQNCVIKNDQKMDTDTAALIKEGRTCLPIRAVIEALGGTVGWDASTKTVIITKPGS